MSRYYFNLTSGRPFNDVDGLELPDLASVHVEAIAFARDMMRIQPERRDWSNWVVCVTDDAQTSVLTLAFSEIVNGRRD